MRKALSLYFQTGMFACSTSVRQKLKSTNEQDLAYIFVVYLNSAVNLLFLKINLHSPTQPHEFQALTTVYFILFLN